MKIGFIGFGEVGSEMSKGFIREGINDIYAYDPLYQEKNCNEEIIKKGVKFLSDPVKVLQYAKIIIVAVPADQSYNAWEKMKDNFDNETIYIDVTTASSDVKKSISNELMGNTILFVDAALMGPLTTYQHTVPINASGKGVDSFIKIMSPYNMNIEKISDKVGDATNVKLVRSIFMKGISAALIETMDIASVYGIEERVLMSIAETMDDKHFEQIASRLITGSIKHSGRRIKEMENVIKLLESNEKDSKISDATVNKLTWLDELQLKEKLDFETLNDWKLIVKNF